MSEVMEMTAAVFEPQSVDIWKEYKRNGHMNIAAFGELDPSDMAEEVFQTDDLNSAELFLYLFRRFGIPPAERYDDLKQACAYCFTTPRPDIFLTVSINGAPGTCLMFGYAITEELGKRIRQETRLIVDAWLKEKDAWAVDNGIITSETVEKWQREKAACPIGMGNSDDNKIKDEIVDRFKEAFPEKYKAAIEKPCGPAQQEANEALRVTLQSFLRPTYIRDVYFNVLGRVYDSDMNYDEETETSSHLGLPVADYCKSYSHQKEQQDG
jgi:hypothetical protein